VQVHNGIMFGKTRVNALLMFVREDARKALPGRSKT